MVLFRNPSIWQLPESQITAEAHFASRPRSSRRRFLKLSAQSGFGLASAIALNSCRGPRADTSESAFAKTLGQPMEDLLGKSVPANASFREGDRPITEQRYASRYNNFYEFGGTKNIWKKAQSLPTEDWKLEVTGLVNKPITYDVDDLLKTFAIEERIYRFRCVEAWAMVVPWIGFPMRQLLEAADPKPEAKFVRFESFYDAQITPGPANSFTQLPWPYHEGLRIEEMANELAFFAVGIYGRMLPKQHGAPIRMVLPWKYGFKGAKSIVKIEFMARQPATYWNTIAPNEYDFQANVNPNIPHPRWSQAKERLVGEGNNWEWKTQPTLLYNGYEEYVSHLY